MNSDFYNGKKRLEQTWRWFGPNDPVSLPHVRQAGAEGVVSALHHIQNGDVWPIDEISMHKAMIESAGLRWSVVESVPVHEDIKKRSGMYDIYIDRYKETLLNLGKCGIKTVCYNFMPVLDWTRTDLDRLMPDGSTGLYFDKTSYVAFDVYVLQRDGADEQYSEEELTNASSWMKSAKPSDITNLERTILAGLPGAEEAWDLKTFKDTLNLYQGIGEKELREHLTAFVGDIAEAADEAGIILTIHPDDPPFSLFGLPRVMSTLDDAKRLLHDVPSPSNGICFCTGSFGVIPDNNLSEMAEALAPHVGFVHLRSTKRSNDGSFYEADHLNGDVDMYAVMKALLTEQQRRSHPIPMRPDHGHKMLDDLNKQTNPGYSAIGRLRGLAELRGLELGILRSLS